MISIVDLGSANTALFMGEPTRPLSYFELGQWVTENRRTLRGVDRPALAFMFGPWSAPAVAAYLAFLAEGIPLGLGEGAPELRERVISVYRPSLLVLPAATQPPPGYAATGLLAGGGWMLFRSETGPYGVTPNRNLALLLATSGSTGDSKFVRLSIGNLEANARAIVEYLGIKPGDAAIQGLPMHYSYGLSVLNSHLAAGAATAITAYSFMHPNFWTTAERCDCTSFAGVPYMYETLERLRMSPAERPWLRTLTQAGGALRAELKGRIHGRASSRGARFFAMYGQTEATARIAYVPPERLPEKLDSIGAAIPGGKLWLGPDSYDSGARQLHYRGANVMLGYASSPRDLELGDIMGGELQTGDLAEQDLDGFFRIVGRLSRIAKMYGRRVNLASVEEEIERFFRFGAAVTDGGDCLKIYLETGSQSDCLLVRSHLVNLLGVPPMSIKMEALGELPHTASGKKDYKALT